MMTRHLQRGNKTVTAADTLKATIVAALLASIAAPAAAAERRVTVPSELLGKWCRTGAAAQGPVLYKRGDCGRMVGS